MEAYCLKCKSQREVMNPSEITLKNGRPATQGNAGPVGPNFSESVKQNKQ